jgi:hypothetical protein
MAHFAKVENKIVTAVIVADQSFIDSGAVGSGWIQTSYNTKGGIHYDSNGNPDGGIPLRKNYASIGDFYDPQHDAFYSPQPYPSWTLDPNTFLWNPPNPYPQDGKVHYWDENSRAWQQLPGQ